MNRALRAAWLAPLVPLATGVAIMLAGGAPRSRWALHLVTGALGVLLYLAARAAAVQVPESARARVSGLTALVALALTAISLLGEGMEGVHRWIRLGPVQLHPSALCAPLLVVLAARWINVYPKLTLLGLAAMQAIHVAQPDAGQATALGAAALVIVVASRSALGVAGSAAAVAILLASVAFAWIRPDPLLPAPFVEDIVHRAFGLGRWLGVLALLSTAPLLAAPLLVRPREPVDAAAAKRAALPGLPDVSAGLALSAYLVCSFSVVLKGEFPVPVLGFGPSPVLGAFLGLAAIAGAARSGAPESVSPSRAG